MRAWSWLRGLWERVVRYEALTEERVEAELARKREQARIDDAAARAALRLEAESAFRRLYRDEVAEVFRECQDADGVAERVVRLVRKHLHEEHGFDTNTIDSLPIADEIRRGRV